MAGPAFSFNWRDELGDPTTSETHAEELFSHFYLLDHNSNGRIELWEAAAGLGVISRQAAIEVIEQVRGNSTVGRAIFAGSDDWGPAPNHPGLFVDCVVLKARKEIRRLPHAMSVDAIAYEREIHFEREITEYFTSHGCGDRMPGKMTINSTGPVSSRRSTCGEIVDRESPGYAKTCAAMAPGGFCRFSCGECVEQARTRRKGGKHLASDRFGGTLHGTTDRSSKQTEGESYVRTVELSGHEEKEDQITILLTSDWHAEPWYQMDGHGLVGNAVTRYPKCTYENEWNCFETDGAKAACKVTGRNDPPRAFIRSHLEGFLNLSVVRENPNQKSVMFFIGDTQVHALYDRFLNGLDPVAVKRDILNETLADIFNYWNSSEIFYTAGNNDGPHNAIFVRQDPASLNWAELLVRHGIVTNSLNWTYSLINSTEEHSQVGFFRHTGYYVKQVPYLSGPGGAGVFAIITNTNLGLNHFDQQRALLTDFQRLRDRGAVVYLFGHHPKVAPRMVPKGYEDMVRGILSGHVHRAETTTPPPQLFTQVPAISQNAVDNAFYVAQVGAKGDYRLFVDYHHDLYVYQGGPGSSPAAGMWRLRGESHDGDSRRSGISPVLIAVCIPAITFGLLFLIVALRIWLHRRSPRRWHPVQTEAGERELEDAKDVEDSGAPSGMHGEKGGRGEEEGVEVLKQEKKAVAPAPAPAPAPQ